MDIKLPAWQRRDDLFIVPPAGWVLISVVLLSVFLAGGRTLWAQGILAGTIGLLWLVWTPGKLPARQVTMMLAILALAPLAAYLPASWLDLPSWRETLRNFPAITTSFFATPQPWLTFNSYLLWLTGLALASWCACQEWDHYNRGTLARMYAGGMLAITLFAIFGHATGYQPSWWVSTDGFGPFINRNQWGAAMGFAGFVSIALIHQCARQDHKQGAIFWALAAVVFIGGILYNGSRGGVVVLVGGGFAYWSIYGILRKQYRYAAIGISFLLISFALFAAGGGALLERFVGLRGLVEGETGEDARIQFYRMTMAMVAGSPLAGFGLGNFEYVFPFYLDFEPMFDRRPVHPESSWLWLASEGGWLLLVAVAVAVLVLILRGFSARKSRAATIRSVGMACAVMLAVNSAFDVSGHRLGTLFPVIMMAALALPPAKEIDITPLGRRGAKFLGVFFVALGAVWLLGGWGLAMLPSVQGTAALQEKAVAAKKAGRSEEAIEILERCEKLRPLDWNIHWTLSGWLLEERKTDPAWREFCAANALIPYLYWTIEEGAAKWIAPAPGRAASAMLEAMERAPEGKRPEIYANFLRKSSDNVQLRSILLRLFPDNPNFEFVRIKQSSPEIAGKRIKRLLEQTENLSKAPDNIPAPILRLMLERGQLEDIDEVVAENPRLKRLAWDVVVERELHEKRTKEALDTYFTYGPKPAIPAALNRSDLRSVERAAALAPLNLSTSIAYYQALAASQRDEDAFWQLRHIMELPGAPPYIWFLAAQAAHRKGDYEEAWTFLHSYQEKTKS